MMISADVNDRRILAALQAGADDYLTKPFNRTELAVRVDNLLLRRPFQIISILFSQRRNRQLHARQINSFSFAQHSAVYYPRHYIGVSRAFHAQFNRAVVQEDARARMDVFRHPVIVGRNLRVVAFDCAGSNRENLSRFEFDRLMIL